VIFVFDSNIRATGGQAHSHPPADPSDVVKNRRKLPLPASIRGNLELRNGEGECIIWGMKGTADDADFTDKFFATEAAEDTDFFDGMNGIYRIFCHG